jgi:membrane dipeptidase
VIATHSNFRTLCPHSRNLTDDMARRIIADGGMIGLNLATGFIHEEQEKRTVEYLFRHLDHCLTLGGENNIGFGCDIDGIERYPAPLTLENSIHDQLIDYMQKHYPERIVEKVAGENYLTFLKKWL